MAEPQMGSHQIEVWNDAEGAVPGIAAEYESEHEDDKDGPGAGSGAESKMAEPKMAEWWAECQQQLCPHPLATRYPHQTNCHSAAPLLSTALEKALVRTGTLRMHDGTMNVATLSTNAETMNVASLQTGGSYARVESTPSA